MPKYDISVGGETYEIDAPNMEELRRGASALKLTLDLRARTEAATMGADARAEAPSDEPGLLGQASDRLGGHIKGLGDAFVRLIAPQPSPEIAEDQAIALRQTFAENGPLAGLAGMANQASENVFGQATAAPSLAADIGRGLGGAQWEQLLKAGDAYRAGSSADTVNLEAPLRFGAAMAPVVGPIAANFVDDLRGGNYGGAAVDAGLAAMPFARQINAGAAGAASRVGKIGAGAGGKTAAVAGAVGRNPIARLISPYRSRELRQIAKERLPATVAPTGDELLIKQLMDGESGLGKMSRESAEAIVKRSKETSTAGAGGSSAAAGPKAKPAETPKPASAGEPSESMRKLIRESSKKSPEPPAGLSAAEQKLWREAADGKAAPAAAKKSAGAEAIEKSKIGSGDYSGRVSNQTNEWSMRGKKREYIKGRVDGKEVTLESITTKYKNKDGVYVGVPSDGAIAAARDFAKQRGATEISLTSKGKAVSPGAKKMRDRLEKSGDGKWNKDGSFTLFLESKSAKAARKAQSGSGLEGGTIERMFKETQARKLKLDLGKPAPKLPAGPHPGKGNVKPATTYGEKLKDGTNTRGVLTSAAVKPPIRGTEKMTLEQQLLASINRMKARDPKVEAGPKSIEQRFSDALKTQHGKKPNLKELGTEDEELLALLRASIKAAQKKTHKK